jgi:hypothetical protein
MKWHPQDNQYIIFRDSKFKDWSVQFQDGGEEGRINYVSNEENKMDVEYFHGANSIVYSNSHISIITGNL